MARGAVAFRTSDLSELGGRGHVVVRPASACRRRWRPLVGALRKPLASAGPLRLALAVPAAECSRPGRETAAARASCGPAGFPTSVSVAVE